MNFSSNRTPVTLALLAATLTMVAACGPRDGSPRSERTATSVGAVTGDTTPPVVTIVTPADGATVLDVLNVDATITDDVGPIVAAQLVVNGVVRQTLKQAPYQFTWDASGFPEDQRVVQVVAVDAAGNLGSSAPLTIAMTHGIVQLKVSSPWVRSGATFGGSLALSGPAPAASWTVALSSEPAGILTHPATVQVREGDVNLPSISLKANAISIDTPVVLTASLNGTQRSVTVDVRSPTSPTLFELAVPGNLQGGTSTTGSITLTNVGASTTVSLSSSDPAVQVPASITASAATTTFPVTTSAVAAPVTATIVATASSGFSRTATINVLPGPVPVPTVVTFSSGTIAVGEKTMATVTLSAPAPPGGALVTLQALEVVRSSLRAIVPDSLTIPAGAQSGSFPIIATPMSSGLRGVFYATFNGVSARAADWLYILREVPEGTAAYNPTLRAPACDALQTSCDTGGLIESRADASEGPEPNWPNTLNASCVDGTAGGPFGTFPGHALYHYDQSVDRLRIWTTDGSPLAAGKTVNVEVKVWVFGFGNLDLLSAADANNPVWTRIGSTSFSGGAQFGRTFTTTFTLPAGPLQAIRANMGGAAAANPPNPCPSDGMGGGSFGKTIDHDDLIFAVGDGQPTDNAAPVVNAGPDQTIGLPAVAILLGRVNDDGRPGALTTTWSKVSGPGTVTFGNPASAQTGARFSIAGTYELRLTANDGALSTSDTVTLAVNTGGAANTAPVVNAGADQIITLPSGTTLTGAVSDDGKPNPPGAATVTWLQLGGPGAATIAAPAAPVTGVTFPVAGSYIFQLSADDGLLSSSDTVVVTVNPVPNMPPVASAGLDQEITLGGAAQLSGAASDDGLPNPPGILQYTWSQVSGPGAASFADAGALQTTAAFSTTGTYVLRLTVNDGALVAADEITILVKPAPVNQPPVVSAGPDLTVTLPAAASLAGTVSDDSLPPMSVVTITWSKVSGPGTVTFANGAMAATTATFSAAGSYVLRLRASDGALATTDTMTVTVNPAITLKVQYRAVSPSPGDNQIRTGVNIVNVGPTAVPLRELKLRYWYTIDSNRPQTVECESAAVGCSRITAAFTTVSPPRPGADRYIEVGFTSSAGNLAAGAQTGEIRGRIRKSDGSNFNEANDYSYAASLGAAPPTSLVDWSRVTLYRNGVRIWGTEP